MTLHHTKTASCLVFSLLPILLSAFTAIPVTFGFAPRLNLGSFQSTNWSGYAVTGSTGSVTDAKGSWKVPAIVGACPSTNQYSSFWVGIDGFNSGTVEQTGTDSDCQGGSPTYYAWYEFYPHPSFIISGITVHPGDTMSAEASFNGRSFTVTIKDTTTGQSFSTSAKVRSAQRSSAEWIAEAPSSSGGILPLADFGTVYFGTDNTGVSSTNYATINGVTGSIGSFGSNVQVITMVSNSGSGAIKAQPSSLSSDGTSFSVTWVSSGP
jgi:peptidase A4-like protein